MATRIVLYTKFTPVRQDALADAPSRVVFKAHLALQRIGYRGDPTFIVVVDAGDSSLRSVALFEVR